MTRVADTSALHAVIDALDEFHAVATAALAAREAILLPREILAETIALIRYRFGAAVASKALVEFLALPHVRIAELFTASNRPSLHDCIVVETCREAAATAFTYDNGILELVA